jgi:hypothetical protein
MNTGLQIIFAIYILDKNINFYLLMAISVQYDYTSDLLSTKCILIGTFEKPSSIENIKMDCQDKIFIETDMGAFREYDKYRLYCRLLRR